MDQLIVARTDTQWFERFQSIGACWRHDGNMNRPHALLTSGKHSDGFLNGDLLKENPLLLDEAAYDLVNRIHGKLNLLTVDCVVGPAMGAITLAHDVARHIGKSPDGHPCRATYAEKVDDGQSTGFAFNRTRIIPDEDVLIVEDVLTTGGSTMKVAEAIREAGGRVLPFVGVLVNRSGLREIEGMRIVALTSFTPETWDKDDCPLCAEGSEAIRPKSNWEAMVRDY